MFPSSLPGYYSDAGFSNSHTVFLQPQSHGGQYWKCKETNQPKKTPNCIKGNALIFLVRIIIHTVAITLAFAKT